MSTGVGHVTKIDPKTGKFEKAYYCHTCDAEKAYYRHTSDARGKKSPSVPVYICTGCGLQVCYEHYSRMKKYQCTAGGLHKWVGHYAHYTKKEVNPDTDYLAPLRRKPFRRHRFPDVGGCNICHVVNTKAYLVPATKVCAYCGLHLCTEHFAKFSKAFCQRGAFEYMENYYLHRWYNRDVYEDPEKWSLELQELVQQEGLHEEIDVVGIRNGKLVVQSKGVVLPRGVKVSTSRLRQHT